MLALCQDVHRRILLALLAEDHLSLTMNDLAKTIVKHNHHTPLTEVSGERMTRIRTDLYHVHIPKLEAAGIVEWDAERQLVEPTEQFEGVEDQLTTIFDADPELAPSLER